MSKIICGIYKITNLINQKSYIGLSKNIETRWVEHRSRARYEKYDSILYRAMRKYGTNNFSFEVLEECEEDELGEKEKYYIEYHRTYVGFDDCNGYNASLGGEDNRGAIWSEESKNRMSERVSNGGNPSAKEICVGDKIFKSIKEASDYLDVDTRMLRRWLTRERKIPKDKSWIIEKNVCLVGETPLSNDDVTWGKTSDKPVFYNGKLFNNTKDCADYMGVNPTSLSLWLRGKAPTPEIYRNVDLDYLDSTSKIFYKDDVPNNSKGINTKYFVYCEDKKFNSVSEVAEYYSEQYGTIYSYIRGAVNLPEKWKNRGLRWERKDELK